MKQLYDVILKNAVFYDVQMSEVKLKILAEELVDLPIEQVIRAYDFFRREPNRRQMPMPADVRARVAPSHITNDQFALEASNKIVEAMSKFGWTNPERAEQFMGPIGWEVVKREGGWAQICERTKNEDLPILKAQWRELAKVVAVRQAQGSERTAIGNEGHAQLEGKST